jgi:cardiolipin synthase
MMTSMRQLVLPTRRLASVFLQFVWICITLSGCASLPDVRDLQHSLYPADLPTVENGQGRLPHKKAESLLSQRLRSTTTDLKALAALEEAATRSPLIAGNKVTLLFDGPRTVAAMMTAIADAKNHINLETYIFESDELGKEFADLLIAKQRAGVQVNIIYDTIGSLNTPPEFFEKMRTAGISLTAFNPVNPLTLLVPWRLNNRDHRKILVVDGRVGFAGGINIADDYSHSSPFRSKKKSEPRSGWRDTHVQIEGPAVAALQWLFLDTWNEQNNGNLPALDFFPPLREVGDKMVRVLASRPGSDFEIYKAYVLAIQEARKTIHLTTAYFVPDAQILESLIDAARRGVSVKLVVPSISDVGLVLYAGRSSYDELLEAGVRIYQFQGSVLHAKTAVIDGVWSTVGSANIDVRSFLHNNEINIVVLGENFGKNMEAAFQEDLNNSVEIDKDAWLRRSMPERMKEWAARTLEYWL